MQELSWEDWWEELVSMAPTDRSRGVIERCRNLYYDQWQAGDSPEDAYYNS